MRNAFGISKQDRLAGVIEIDGQLDRKVARNVSPTDVPDAYRFHGYPGYNG